MVEGYYFFVEECNYKCNDKQSSLSATFADSESAINYILLLKSKFPNKRCNIQLIPIVSFDIHN